MIFTEVQQGAEACGHPYVCFMVPDFNELRKSNCDRTEQEPSNLTSDKGFCPQKKSQQFNNEPDNSASSTQSIHSDSESDETDQFFFRLWIEQPSWSPIIKNHQGWKTAISPDGIKKVPLTLGSIKSHYRRHIVLGKRFGKFTNYLLIDIDIGSPFHPRNGGIEPILAAMESVGLCRYLIIRSSDSGGIHIYFPLAEPVSSWGLACAAHAALTAAGVKIGGGICELFPNRKAYNAEHNGHRLPLQDGSFVLDSDFRCSGNSRAVFLQQWQHCTAGQNSEHLAELLTEKPLPVPKHISSSPLPPIGWTNESQSNEVMKKLVNYGDRELGLKTIPTLGGWMVATAPQLPGFEQFASQESKNDLTRHNWAYRWAKSHFKSVRMYKAKISFDHNAMVAAEALERLMVALSRIVVAGKLGIKALWHALSNISKELFGVGFSWKVFQKHRKLILESVESSCSLGLSKGSLEDIDTFSSETPGLMNAGTGEGLKGESTQLLTARSVTPIQNKDLRPSNPPLNLENSELEKVSELATGTAVIFQAAGGAVASVKTRITGKAAQPDGTLLYRLEECAQGRPLMASRDCLTTIAEEPKPYSAEATIEATAAQLLQVLGKACPFVGPGLWLVKRSEVTLKAWNQLQRLAEPS